MRLGILCFCAYFILRLLLVRLFVAFNPQRTQYYLIDTSFFLCYSKTPNFAYVCPRPEFLFLQWYRESSSLNIRARPAAIAPDDGTDID